MGAAALVADLQKVVGPDRVVSDPAELFVYESDGFTIAKARPGAAVFVQSTDEVVKLVKRLGELGVQIVPRGTGTGLTGGCVAFENGVIISTARMNRILKMDLENRSEERRVGKECRSRGSPY